MFELSRTTHKRHIKKMSQLSKKLEEMESQNVPASDKNYEKLTIEYLQHSLSIRKYNQTKLRKQL